MDFFPSTLPTTGEKPKTIEQGGVAIPSFDTPLHLLPLLQRPSASSSSSSPPLHRLPSGRLSKERIVFQTPKAQWVSTSHVFPAAFPRSHPQSIVRPGLDDQHPAPNVEALRLTDKQRLRQMRMRDMQYGSDQLKSISVESMYPPSSAQEAEERARRLADEQQHLPALWNTAQRIVPLYREDAAGPPTDQQRRITLVLLHANGFHSEIWEPTLQRLIESIEEKEAASRGPAADDDSKAQPLPPRVDEIWSLDLFNAGQAGVLNRDLLGTASPWFDIARDIQNFMRSYLPPPSSAHDVAAFGPRWLPSQLPVQSNNGAARAQRTVIGVSQSIAGGAMTMATLCSADGNLFDGLVSVDPMIHRWDFLPHQPLPSQSPTGLGAFARVDTFENEAALLRSMASKPFFQAWDERVRALHARFGFTPVDPATSPASAPITLCKTKWSEGYSFAHVYVTTWTMRAVRDRLAAFKGWIHFMYSDDFQRKPSEVNAEDEHSVSILPRSAEQVASLFSQAEQQRQKTEGRSRLPFFFTEPIQGSHLIVQHDPDRVGVKFAKILCDRYGDGTSEATRSSFTVSKAKL